MTVDVQTVGAGVMVLVSGVVGIGEVEVGVSVVIEVGVVDVE